MKQREKELNLAKHINSITEKTTAYGTIIDVGKVDPRIEISLVSGERLFFPVKYDNAIDLAKHLYKKIEIIGTATLNPITYKITSFQLEDYVILNDSNYKEKFEILRELIGDDWDKINDPKKYLDLNDLGESNAT